MWSEVCAGCSGLAKGRVIEEIFHLEHRVALVHVGDLACRSASCWDVLKLQFRGYVFEQAVRTRGHGDIKGARAAAAQSSECWPQEETTAARRGVLWQASDRPALGVGRQRESVARSVMGAGRGTGDDVDVAGAARTVHFGDELEVPCCAGGVERLPSQGDEQEGGPEQRHLREGRR